MSGHLISFTSHRSHQRSEPEARHHRGAQPPSDDRDPAPAARADATERGAGRGSGRAERLLARSESSTRPHLTASQDDSSLTDEQLTDEQLLEAMASDLTALGALYDRHAKLVHGLALAILGSREEAEDLTQEVFVTICGPHLYDRSRGSVSGFLVTMTRSRALDRLRRRHRSARLLKSWHEAEPAPAVRTPLEDVSMRRASERARAVLAELPEVQRKVLELAYYRGLSQTEIAAELDTPLGTVKGRLRRALLALSDSLDEFNEAGLPNPAPSHDRLVDDRE
jgi:RNA polymerase sigma-70 factor (ECF subfamily)